eukprot:1144534-Pelagomonas_calceolata.AAC.2
MAYLVEGMGSVDNPTHTQKDCVEGDLGTLNGYGGLNVQFKLPGWICPAPCLFVSSRTAEFTMARSDQNSAWAAQLASSLIRNAASGVKEVWRYYAIRDLLRDVQVMLGQTVCAASICTRFDP